MDTTIMDFGAISTAAAAAASAAVSTTTTATTTTVWNVVNKSLSAALTAATTAVSINDSENGHNDKGNCINHRSNTTTSLMTNLMMAVAASNTNSTSTTETATTAAATTTNVVVSTAANVLHTTLNTVVSTVSASTTTTASSSSLSPSSSSSMFDQTYLLCLIQKHQEQLHAIRNRNRNSTHSLPNFPSIEEIYSREIIRLVMEFNRQHLNLQDILVMIVYGLVVIVSLFGNLLVCKVILFKRSMRRRTTNVFIANLTISDLLMTVFTIPMFIVRTIMDNWPLGEVLCKLFPLVTSMSVYVSVLSMTMIAIDRYQALIKPLESRVSHRVPKSILIGLIWTIAILLSVPHAVFNKVVEIRVLTTGDGESLHRCQVVYPHDAELTYTRIQTCLAFLTQFCIPLLIVALCYTMIGLKISKRACIGETTVEQAQTHLNAKRKTIKMLIFVVVVFAICWLPYNLLYIFKDFYQIDFSLLAHYAAHWLAMSSICYNPFIYFWLNNGYRQGILSVLTCCCTTGSMVAQHTDVEQNRTTIFQRSLSRSCSSGFQPVALNSFAQLNNNNNGNNGSNGNNNNNSKNNNNSTSTKVTAIDMATLHPSRSRNSLESCVSMTTCSTGQQQQQQRLLTVPSSSSYTNNGDHHTGSSYAQQEKNDNFTTNKTGKQWNNDASFSSSSNNNNNNSTGSSRHLEIIYISLKEKFHHHNPKDSSSSSSTNNNNNNNDRSSSSSSSSSSSPPSSSRHQRQYHNTTNTTKHHHQYHNHHSYKNGKQKHITNGNISFRTMCTKIDQKHQHKQQQQKYVQTTNSVSNENDGKNQNKNHNHHHRLMPLYFATCRNASLSPFTNDGDGDGDDDNDDDYDYDYNDQLNISQNFTHTNFDGDRSDEYGEYYQLMQCIREEEMPTEEVTHEEEEEEEDEEEFYEEEKEEHGGLKITFRSS